MQWLWLIYTLVAIFAAVHSLRPTALLSRRAAIVTALVPVVSIAATGAPEEQQQDRMGPPDRFDVDNFIRTGIVANPMGVSGQAGKSRPETGVLLRDGSEISRDSRTGDVLAEIILQSKDDASQKVPVLASFSSPWPLATGTVFDIECRNANTGDGSFMAVTSSVGSKTIQELSDSFFVDQLTRPTGRFSFYGTPTDIKVRSSSTQGNYRVIDFSFSSLSQSTQAEIPRRARIVATIPAGTQQAVMLVGSASATRWKQGSEEVIAKVGESFRAIPAPPSSMRIRVKERRASS